MKRWFKIVLLISLIINCFFIVVQILYNRHRSWSSESNKPFDIKSINIKEEKNKFFAELKKADSTIVNKKYFYINVWATGSYYSMKQLPKLDTVITPLRNDMSYMLVCDEKSDYAFQKLKEHKIQTKNFTFINQADSFVYAVCKEKKIKMTWGFSYKSPMNLIMDRTGKILYFDTAYAITGLKNDSITDKKYILTLKKALKDLK